MDSGYGPRRPPDRPGGGPRAIWAPGGVSGVIYTPRHGHGTIGGNIYLVYGRYMVGLWGLLYTVLESTSGWSRTDATDMYTRIHMTTGLPGTVYTPGMGWEARWQP